MKFATKQTKQNILNIAVVSLLLMGLFVLVPYFQQFYHDVIRRAPAKAGIGKCLGLDLWYRHYNEEYFNDELPTNTVVDYGGHDDDFIATTSSLTDGRLHIAMNEKYTSAPRTAHLYLLHEMCHVKTWDEKEEHGKRWRTCMLVLDFEGAFKEILIDGYVRQERP